MDGVRCRYSSQIRKKTAKARKKREEAHLANTAKAAAAKRRPNAPETAAKTPKMKTRISIIVAAIFLPASER